LLVVFAGDTFFPSRTDAGRGLRFFATGLAASFVVFFASTFLVCVTFATGLVKVFEFGFDGAIDKPITGTATKPIAATAAHFIQLFIATPLPKPILITRPAPRPPWELAHKGGAAGRAPYATI
jgi:hypothetical protein